MFDVWLRPYLVYGLPCIKYNFLDFKIHDTIYGLGRTIFQPQNTYLNVFRCEMIY